MKRKKIENKFKVNKLFLYTILNSFIIFLYIYKLNNLKLYIFLNNFNYIYFSFIYFHNKIKYKKFIILIFFFFCRHFWIT